MISELKQRLSEASRAVAPLFGLVCLLQFTLVHAPAALFLQFIAGTPLVIGGMMLLFMGVEIGILPMGRFIGAALPRRGSITLIMAVAFAVGFAVTVAEPDVLILAGQVERMSQGAINGTIVLYVVALGVGTCVALAMARIVYGTSLRLLLGTAFAAVLVLSFFAPSAFVPLAYDAGSVTTGILTAPVVIALAIGLSSVLAGRSAAADGFGLLGFASIGAIIAVMIMGMVMQ